VTHDPRLAARMDRTLTIERGVLREDGHIAGVR
jgi:predicted ABC-type transport system involved in lysophospholipase L1 biosynthesis ATPase subunit